MNKLIQYIKCCLGLHEPAIARKIRRDGRVEHGLVCIHCGQEL